MACVSGLWERENSVVKGLTEITSHWDYAPDHMKVISTCILSKQLSVILQFNPSLNDFTLHAIHGHTGIYTYSGAG